ncbi:hypothetical protein ACHAXT_010116 [Thalassiosira profunda]
MEQLICSLSKESDDDKRREKLAGILDKELSDASADDATKGEVPRFAQLFQVSLDTVGEQVQTAAREAALEKQQSDNGLVAALEGDADYGKNGEGADGGDTIERRKSPEELQLWALIDMMVQSKTRVKLYMGSLGSQGEFR